ncbi:LacI family DNA-binding transcriptional regulator [Actinoplanes subtropicus]|uniref:LacI family DNA-binding transcriptional regulator n=1 Tax=Actinoplanes subtropicus TaxID=543632 RepID=UPI0004C382B3|nr:LacI family DNA-binding transcriptional regulator [Actinoplanes subtropicus]
MTTSRKRRPLPASRRNDLLEALRRDDVLRISDLAETLGVAEVTLRRDVVQLAKAGLVRRVHGGVALPEEEVAEPAEETAGQRIGMLVPSAEYYYPTVAEAAKVAAGELGIDVVLRTSSYDAEDELPLLERLVEQGAGALIVTPRMDAPTTQRTVDWLAGTELPVVLLERTATAGPYRTVLESVVTDHALGAEMAVNHLMLLGHRRIGVVLAEHSPTSPHVRRGWVDALGGKAAKVDALVPDARSPDSARALDAVLDSVAATGTTALLVHADNEAMALVQRCEMRGLAVPGDLSVVAYDDQVAHLCTPALTAVRPPLEAIGRAAVRLVADRLADPERPAHRVVINPSLQIRQSTSRPA